MRGVPRARRNRRLRLLIGRARVTKRDTQPAGGQPLNQIESTFDFWCDRDDADIGRAALDFGEDLSSLKFVANTISSPSRLSSPSCPSSPSWPSRASHFIPASKRRTWVPQTSQWLCPFVFGADEIAFKMRRQHSRGL